MPVKNPGPEEFHADAVALFGTMTEAARTAARVDWAATGLGPVSTWPTELRIVVLDLMACSLPMNIMWGRDLVQIYNDAYRSTLGDKHPAAMGQPVRLSISTDVWTDLMEPLIRSVEATGEAVHRVDERVLAHRYGHDPEETYWTFSLSPLRDDAGIVAGVLLTNHESTHAVLARRRIGILHDLASAGLGSLPVAEAGERITAALARHQPTLPVVAIYLAESGETLHRIAGYGEECPSALRSERIPVGSEHPYAQAFEQRTMIECGTFSDHPDHGYPGSSHRCPPIVALPLPNTHGEIGVVALGTNPYRPLDEAYREFLHLMAHHIGTILAESRHVERRDAESRRMRLVDAAKTRFYQDVSHEFRTPLTLVRLAVDELSRDAASAQRRHLATIDQAAAQLDRLVDALILFIRTEVQFSSPPSAAALRLGPETEAVVGMFRGAADSAGLELKTRIEDVAAVPVDRETWVSIVGNLMSNAVKYTEAGEISVRLSRDGDWIRLSVSDTGIGIPPGERDAVFDRFQRSSRLPRKDVNGLGLGLSLVADLVQAHGGTVSVTGEPGQGSTFTVVLPAPRHVHEASSSPDAIRVPSDIGPTDEPAATAPRAPSAVPAHQPTPPGTAPAPNEVLLVEDNDDLRGYLVDLLTANGWQVHAVPDTAAALELTEPPDVILSDIMMPGPSGLDLVREVRIRPRWERVPILLLTARAGSDAVVEGMSAGADDYLVKPFHPQELLARLTVHRDLAAHREEAITQAEARVDNLQAALSTSRRIGLAIGILMARERLTADAAFDRLRQVSNDRNQKLRDLAEDVILTGILEELPRSQTPTKRENRQTQRG